MGLFQNQHPFNWRNQLAISIFGIGIISNGVYICCEAKTFQEYADSVFTATALTSALMIFTFFALIKRLIFACLTEAEPIIGDFNF